MCSNLTLKLKVNAMVYKTVLVYKKIILIFTSSTLKLILVYFGIVEDLANSFKPKLNLMYIQKHLLLLQLFLVLKDM